MKVVRQVEEWLQETGLPYDLVTGSNHIKVRMCGRQVTILPLKGRCSETDKRGMLNTRSQIRRAARELSSMRQPAMGART